MSLPGGLVLRHLEPSDLPATQALLAERGDPSDAVDLALVVDDPSHGPDACAVVVDGNRVVSTATLLDEVLVLDDQPIPCGQVELVATDPAYEGRGLVRALMGWAHDRSRACGHMAQVMIGIPFFYRQFGYAYSIPMRRWRALASRPPLDAGVTVRRATLADVPALQALEAHAQAGCRLRMAHTEPCWRWVVQREGSELWVAERDGSVVASARVVPPAEGAALGELAGTDAGAALTLVARTAAPDLRVQERPGTVAGDALEHHLAAADDKADWYYARIERLGPLLTHLAPMLTARLAATGLADRDHEVLLSSWRSHVRLRIGPDGVHDLVEGGPEQRPVSKGGSGIPPDGLAPLLFGPHGALGLEQLLPDCHLGRQRDLMAALFPPIDADLATFYLPV
jgi:predicted N-acetyltransferase YhbS